MSGPIKVRCPHCTSTMKLKDARAVGKKVACPKCGEPFTVKPLQSKPKPKPKPKVEEPAFEEMDLDGYDDYEGDDFAGANDEFDDYEPAAPIPQPAPTRSTKKNSGGKKRKRKSANWVKPTLIGGGVVCGVLLLAGVIGLAVMYLPGAVGGGLDLAYLPADAEAVAVIRIADAWGSSAFDEARADEQARQGIEKMRETIGLEPSQIESVTVAATGLSAMKQAAPSMFGLPDFSQMKFVAVVRTTQPVDQQKLFDLSPNRETLQHAGQEYHRITTGQAPFAGNSLNVFFAEGGTVVLGSEALVKQAIDSGGRAASRPEFDFVDPDGHIVLAVVPQAGDFFSSSGTSPLSTAMAMQGVPASEGEKIRGFCLGVSILSDEVDTQISVNCTDAAAAQELKRGMETAKEKQLEQLETSRQNMQNLMNRPGMQNTETFDELIDRQKQSIESAQTWTSGTTASIRTLTPIPKQQKSMWSQLLSNRGGLSGMNPFSQSGGAPGQTPSISPSGPSGP